MHYIYYLRIYTAIYIYVFVYTSLDSCIMKFLSMYIYSALAFLYICIYCNLSLWFFDWSLSICVCIFYISIYTIICDIFVYMYTSIYLCIYILTFFLSIFIYFFVYVSCYIRMQVWRFYESVCDRLFAKAFICIYIYIIVGEYVCVYTRIYGVELTLCLLSDISNWRLSVSSSATSDFIFIFFLLN